MISSAGCRLARMPELSLEAIRLRRNRKSLRERRGFQAAAQGLWSSVGKA
jgi:hypothetical protein